MAFNKKRLIIILLLLAYLPNYAQSLTQSNLSTLRLYEDSLKVIGNNLINSKIAPERINASYKLAKTLVRALKTPYSYNYNFDSLQTITIQKSPDNRLRIFSWHVLFDDGSYRYYGAIQMNETDGKLKIFGLVDYSSVIKHPQDTVTNNDKWYGAQYYKIIPAGNPKAPYYTLLGWKGNTLKTTKKVIEVLSFKNDKPVFGMPVFDGYAGNVNRVIFEYSHQVSMMMNYEPSRNRIILDHLSPPGSKMTGKYDLYGPDLSYDVFILANGRWLYKQNIEAKNQPSADDEKYLDPRKAKSTNKKKL